MKSPKNTNDEFYTRYEDVERIMKYFKDEVRGKNILLPVDDITSQFWKYFVNNFDELGVASVTAISRFSLYKYTGPKNQIEFKRYDGDITKNTINEEIENADIIITNPPFSIFSSFYSKVRHKNHIILLPLKSLKNIFEDIKELKAFPSPFNVTKFRNEHNEIVESPCCWITNIKKIKKEKIEIKKYDNYDAYEFKTIREAFIDNTKKIKGVPITYLQHHDPERFKIIDIFGRPKLNGKRLFSRVIIEDLTVS